MPRFIDPLKELGKKLLEVEKPARYTGGEFGMLARRGGPEPELRAIIAFPDLYEIGMSNQAFRIIYNRLNAIPGISCDRAFAPAPDFEALLEREQIPLYGLDTGIALSDTDLLCFTLGYELGLSGVLTMLRASGIPLRAKDRGETSPIVIMGGPCVSNPLPYSLFTDAFWIGEAEAGFFDLSAELLELKKKAALQNRGGVRAELLSRITSHPNVWVPGKTGVRRAVYSGFGQKNEAASVFPVSSIRTVQHHGAVEIMRGCPNGCRFCHAGMWYRPMRQKQAPFIFDEVDEQVNKGGYREISLSSLSSGDYCRLGELVDALNSIYGKRRVSFQLPSLKVSTFSLSLLDKISEVRKSGLTFAVETPLEMRQLALNKTAALAEIVSILKEAKQNGWRGAKFYFMTGLPPEKGEISEEESIVNFVIEAARQSGGHFHITAGTFVPKPHTPYERAAQEGEEEAWHKLRYIMARLKPKGHKVSVHDPFTAQIEGLLARGDERAGEIAEQAFLLGARLDAWPDYLRKDIWKDLFEQNRGLVEEILSEKPPEAALPWEDIESGVSKSFLLNEARKSENSKITSPCIQNCTHNCGICRNSLCLVQNSRHIEVNSQEDPAAHPPDTAAVEIPGTAAARNPPSTFRMIFSFEKTGSAIFIPHLGTIETFSMAFTRAGRTLNPVYSQGFNPHLKLEFASPAAVGLVCHGEIACVDFTGEVDPQEFSQILNQNFPKGLKVLRAELYEIPFGEKKHSLSAMLSGFRYGNEIVEAPYEKRYRIEHEPSSFFIRSEVLAHDPHVQTESQTASYCDYFTAYGQFYRLIA